MKTHSYLSGIIFLLSLNPGLAGMPEVRSGLKIVLPDSIDGWKVSLEDQIYNRSNLHDYIDGGAELYLSYDFRTLFNRTYSRLEQPDILVDVFDMSSSRDAFGVFSHSRETVEKTFGQGSQYTGGLLLFWKDRYFVSILSSPETVESKQAVQDLAKNIDTAISEEGPLPEILTFLPKQELVEESIRYFRHYVWLNSHYFVAAENILHINEKTEAVLAKYGKLGNRSILLLVKYPNVGDAKLGHDDFIKQYLPELSGKTAVKIEDGTWTACLIMGNLLAVIFNAPSEDTAFRLMKEVQQKYEAQ